MDDRNRVTVRLAAETIAGWPHAVVTDNDKLAAHATSLLVAALGTVSLDFHGIEMLKKAHTMGTLCESLETLRRRLRLAVPLQPEDADLAPMVQASHEALESHLYQLSIALKMLQTRMPFLFGTLPHVFENSYIAAQAAVTSALRTDRLSVPVGLEFCLGLLLLVTDAIPPLPNIDISLVLGFAQDQRLLPADRMIGLPQFPPVPEDLEEPEMLRLKLTAPQAAKFSQIAKSESWAKSKGKVKRWQYAPGTLPWSENECANQLILEHAADPAGADNKVQYETRRATIRSLVRAHLTLYGLINEAEFCAFKTAQNTDHVTFLHRVAATAASLEARVLDLVYPLAGSGWAYAPEFLRALEPLLANVTGLLASPAELTTGEQAMIQYLQLLKILPPPTTSPR